MARSVSALLAPLLPALSALVALGPGCEPAKSAPPAIVKPPIDPNGPREVAILAGGCFWGMENVMRQAPGVVSIEVGYSGGKSTKVSYDDVSDGNTGHAESVRIVFDPNQISYESLLAHWFFRAHDPTTVDRQNNDVGTQYRSEIFTTSEAQRKTAEAVKARVDKSGKWRQPIVTRIEPATTWVRAEEYHQDYLIKHPGGYNDHWLREFDF
ncbi:MAG TPA: peptide-methionine (S)-S-oxide reductase MsrA [Kofleriaceae bacterium]